MAVLSSATASGKRFFQGYLSTSAGTVYFAPDFSANVTTPSATAYIKEIIICNTGSSSVNVTIYAGANAIANSILYSVPIPGNDSKIISGINLMIPANGTVHAFASTASALVLTISGVEVQ